MSNNLITQFCRQLLPARRYLIVIVCYSQGDILLKQLDELSVCHGGFLLPILYSTRCLENSGISINKGIAQHFPWSYA